MIYIDTSVLVAYYCPEKISERVEQILIETSKPAISQLTEVELNSAVSRKVRENELSKAGGGSILAKFRSHVDKKSYIFLPLQKNHFSIAMDWIAQFDTPLRTLDALHLAIAHFNKIPLLTADIKLSQAASSFGIETTLIVWPQD